MEPVETNDKIINVKNDLQQNRPSTREMLHQHVEPCVNSRRNNIILMGVPEKTSLKTASDKEAITDEEKMKEILKEVDCQHTNIVKMKRIGVQNKRIRSILITMKTTLEKQEVFKKSNKLK